MATPGDKWKFKIDMDDDTKEAVEGLVVAVEALSAMVQNVAPHIIRLWGETLYLWKSHQESKNAVMDVVGVGERPDRRVIDDFVDGVRQQFGDTGFLKVDKTADSEKP